MGAVDQIFLQVQPNGNDDEEEIDTVTRRLRIDLLDLDVDSVDPIAGLVQASGAKGIEPLVGGLAVRLGIEGVRTVIAAVAGWATRTGRTIEVTYDGETLKVSAATAAQQERIITDFLARHASRA